jgi:hypothetical protein
MQVVVVAVARLIITTPVPKVAVRKVLVTPFRAAHRQVGMELVSAPTQPAETTIVCQRDVVVQYSGILAPWWMVAVHGLINLKDQMQVLIPAKAGISQKKPAFAGVQKILSFVRI